MTYLQNIFWVDYTLHGLDNNHRSWQPLFFHMIWLSSHETSRHIVEWITLSCYFATSIFRHLTIHGSRTIPSLELDNLFTVHFLSPNLYLRPFLSAILFCLSLLFQWSPVKTPISSKNHSMASFRQNRKYNRFICRPFSRQNSFKSLYKNSFSRYPLHDSIPSYQSTYLTVPGAPFSHSVIPLRHSVTPSLRFCLHSDNQKIVFVPTMIHSKAWSLQQTVFQQSAIRQITSQQSISQQSIKISNPSKNQHSIIPEKVLKVQHYVRIQRYRVIQYVTVANHHVMAINHIYTAINHN